MTSDDPYAHDLWAAVSGGDHYAAADTAMSALKSGTTAETVLMDLLAPVQLRVGEEWAAGRMTVAQEHVATSVCGHAVEVVAAHRPVAGKDAPPGGRIVVTCSDREWHSFPARLLAVVLQMRGWRVDYLGAQMPTPHLVAHLRHNRPDAVALSSTTTARLPAAHTAVIACHELGVPVLVGGGAYGPDGRYVPRLRADGWAPDGTTAADLLAAGILRAPPAGHRLIDDLPHLADQEYTLVAQAVPDLVGQAMTAAHPEGGDPRELRETAERLTETAEALAVALYLDDPRPFHDTLTWTSTVLDHRAPSGTRAVPALLETLDARFTDFLRTRTILAEALG